MKLRALFATAALSVGGLATTAVHAQTVTPCEVYMCMAGISGVGLSGGPACAPAIAFWHTPAPAGLAVWGTYVFLPPPSAELRREYLTMGCPAANFATNAAILNAIIAEWGWEP